MGMAVTLSQDDVELVKALMPYVSPRARSFTEALLSVLPETQVQSGAATLEAGPLRDTLNAVLYNAYTLFLILILLLLSDVPAASQAHDPETGHEQAQILPASAQETWNA